MALARLSCRANGDSDRVSDGPSSQRRRDRFDGVVGRGWITLGLDVDPAAALTADQRAGLERLQGRFVTLTTAKTAGEGTGTVIDVGGTYADWLERLEATFVILRPDFYVAATAGSTQELQDPVDTLLRQVGLSEDSISRTPAVA